MSELIPLLFLLICPIAMGSMMFAPALARRFARRAKTTTVGDG